ncbi:MAG TPA: hypothetical protein VGI12_04575 [Vicinamibacterales bacterium]|jgi:hypothetical protein
MAALISRTALQVNAMLALAALAAAAALMALVLTQPETVAAAVGQHEYGTLAAAVVHEFAGWVQALLRFV